MSGMALLTLALAAPACAFQDERGTLVHSPNPTPAFEAAGRPWFENGATIDYAGGVYAKFGLPRQLAPTEVEAAADREGVPFFIEAGNYVDKPEVIYVMVRSHDCSFQPYARK
jgi:hypothetical protein